MLSAALSSGAGVRAAETAAADQFSVRFDHDSYFQSYPSVTWTRSLASGGSLYGAYVNYLSYQTSELDVGLNRPLGAAALSCGLGTTLGTAGWGLAGGRQYVGRDAVPQLTFYGAGRRFEGEAYHAAWIPLQEGPSTKVMYAQTRWWLAVKDGSWGAGPHVESLWTKAGDGPMLLSHLWLGAHVLKEWPADSFQLFGGYDPVTVASFFGSPKRAGAVFRVTYVHNL